jgi:hypothetical protein
MSPRGFDRSRLSQKVPSTSACFCRMTQISLLCLLTLKALFEEETMTNHQAIAAYRRLRQDPRVGWLGEPEGLEANWMLSYCYRACLRGLTRRASLDFFQSMHHCEQ